ncbi:chaplin family protein [Planotetraspora sp. A-T 1434]|uniref:chaplin family protein n=1 Tax=Planotetraspora sp. A-T 1434 TaxID=2979219 RepID=UPI0021BF727A|nr:chaplin family protein [Planotetraspora sp. A-T 1434]MCT9929811.1 chaplin family protein [Planotetraspora sp. A-T 1434]
MRTWAKGSAPAAFLAAGVMTLGSGTALADTGGNGSIGGGNQVNLPVTLPIDISGNAVGVAGESSASSQGGASVEGAGGGIANRTSGNGSILGGNQVNAPVTAPINACGNAVSLFGRSDAGCKGGATVRGSRRGGAGGNVTNGDHSLLGGNQIIAPITAPINACGNAVAIFGDATAGCRGGASVRNAGGGAGGNRTSGRSSILGGNQVIAPITAPINVCGNSVAVLGEAFSGCKGGSSVEPGGHYWPGHGWRHGGHEGHGWGHGGHEGHGWGHGYGGGHWHGHPGSTGNDTDGRFAAGSGNQVIGPITGPVNVCGNAVGHGSGSCKGGSSVSIVRPGNWAGGNRTDGRSSILGGNQVVAPIILPVNICGNAVAIAGEAFAGCRGGASVHGGWSRHWGHWGHRGAGHNTTSGRSSILGGNQVVAPITAPINVCGNAVAVLGDAAAGCLGGARVGSHGHGGHHHGGYWARSETRGVASRGGALLPALPGVPALSGLKEASGVPQQMSAAAAPSAPVMGDLPNMLGLPELPSVPGAPAASPAGHAATTGKGSPVPPAVSQVTGSLPVNGTLDQATGALPANGLGQTTKGLPVNGVEQVTKGLPVNGVDQATDALPLKNLGLMSAEQPVGVTGMNPGSFAALVLGAMFAASATLFAATRRFRFGRK